MMYLYHYFTSVAVVGTSLAAYYAGFGCRDYSFLTSCDFSEVFNVAFNNQNDGITTGNELLEQVAHSCSNHTGLELFYGCLDDIIIQCPAERSMLLDATAEKVAFFCDANRVSSWLRDRLGGSYSYNIQCELELTTAVNTCGQELLSVLNLKEEMSLNTVPFLVSAMFHCLNQQHPSSGSAPLECGSSWPDIVLRFWIQVLLDQPLGYSLTENQIARLKDSGRKVPVKSRGVLGLLFKI